MNGKLRLSPFVWVCMSSDISSDRLTASDNLSWNIPRKYALVLTSSKLLSCTGVDEAPLHHLQWSLFTMAITCLEHVRNTQWLPQHKPQHDAISPPQTVNLSLSINPATAVEKSPLLPAPSGSSTQQLSSSCEVVRASLPERGPRNKRVRMRTEPYDVNEQPPSKSQTAASGRHDQVSRKEMQAAISISNPMPRNGSPGASDDQAPDSRASSK